MQPLLVWYSLPDLAGRQAFTDLSTVPREWYSLFSSRRPLRADGIAEDDQRGRNVHTCSTRRSLTLSRHCEVLVNTRQSCMASSGDGALATINVAITNVSHRLEQALSASGQCHVRCVLSPGGYRNRIRSRHILLVRVSINASPLVCNGCCHPEIGASAARLVFTKRLN